MKDDEIRARLHSLADAPVPDETRAAHLRRMSAAGTSAEPTRRGLVWAGIAAAAVVGFLAGSTGLAMADALPDSAQSVAHDVLGAVKVDVPQGKQGKRGPCVSEAAKIKDKGAKKAVMAACPKDVDQESGDDNSADGSDDGHDSDTGRGNDNGNGHAEGPPASDDPCPGRPPWAGPMSKEQREAAKASGSRANCPEDDEADRGSGEDSEADGQVESSETSSAATTIAPTTTSIAGTTTVPAEPSTTGDSSGG